MSQDGLLRVLRKHLDDGNVLVVAGTGVSIETSGNASCASWKGLITDGIKYAYDHDLIDDSAAKNLRADLTTNNFAEWPHVAQRLSEALQAPGGDFGAWLESSIGISHRRTAPSSMQSTPSRFRWQQRITMIF